MAREAAAAESRLHDLQSPIPLSLYSGSLFSVGILTWTPKDYGVRVRVNLKKPTFGGKSRL